MQRGAVRRKKVPATLAAIELSPGAATGMPVGRDIAPPEPAPIATGGIGTEMLRGVDVTAAASCRRNRRGWRRRGLQPWSLAHLFTSSATGWRGGARKGGGLLGVLAPGQQGLGGLWWRGGRGGCPQPIGHREQQPQADRPGREERE